MPQASPLPFFQRRRRVFSARIASGFTQGSSRVGFLHLAGPMQQRLSHRADDQIYLDLASLDGLVVHSDDYTLTITSIQDATP